MDRNISENQEENKANFFKKKTTEELKKELKVYQAMDSGMLADNILKELTKREIIDTVITFYNNLKEHKNHRYMSWEHCFNAFQSSKHSNDVDYLSLQLAFYLASWGMYRGSSGLLWKDYKIHAGAVQIIKKYDSIHCEVEKEINETQIDTIIKAKDELKEYYSKVQFVKPTKDGDKKSTISPSDTLISKILLGTLGCVPAYDRLLRAGFDEMTSIKIGKSLNPKSLSALFKFTSNNQDAFKTLGEKINKDGVHYPLMKLVDMYFWETGRLSNPGLMDKEDL